MKMIGLFVASSLLAAVTVASPITVNNFSFESLPAGGLTSSCGGTNCLFSPLGTPVPSWTMVGGAGGQFQPGNPANTNYYNVNMPDGITLAYLNGGTLSQTTAATVVAGVTYTLQVDVGFRKDGFGGIGDVFLSIGGTNIAATGPAPVSGGFSTLSVVYLGTAIDAGKTIAVILSTPAVGQGNFDNVRLNDDTAAAGVPEPASVVLMGVGLAAVGLFRRKLTARR